MELLVSYDSADCDSDDDDDGDEGNKGSSNLKTPPLMLEGDNNASQSVVTECSHDLPDSHKYIDDQIGIVVNDFESGQSDKNKGVLSKPASSEAACDPKAYSHARDRESDQIYSDYCHSDHQQLESFDAPLRSYTSLRSSHNPDESELRHRSSVSDDSVTSRSMFDDPRVGSSQLSSPAPSDNSAFKGDLDCRISDVIGVDYFNLDSQTSDSSEDLEKCGVDKISKTEITHPGVNKTAYNKKCPNDFWNTVSPACDWSCSKKIWGVPHDYENSSCYDMFRAKNSSSAKNRTGNGSSSDTPVKRQKLINDANESVSFVGKSSIAPPYYVVHHKIAPHLQEARLRKTVYRYPKKVSTVLAGHGGTVNRISWCIPEFGHLLLSTSMDSTVRIWNVFSSTSNFCVQTLRFHKKAVKDAVWHETGRQVVSCGFDKTARLSDVERGSELCVFQVKDFATCVKWYPLDSNLFIAGSSDLMVAWDIRSPANPVRNFKYKDKFGQVQDICFLTNGTQLLSCADIVSRDSADRNIMVWDFGSGAVMSNQIFHERFTCTRLRAHPTCPLFLAQTQGNYIAEFSAVYPYRINKCKRFEGHKVAGYGVGFDITPDGAMVASGSADGQLLIYDHAYAKVLSRLPTDQKNDVVLDVAWNPVLFSTVAAGLWSGDIVIWQ